MNSKPLMWDTRWCPSWVLPCPKPSFSALVDPAQWLETAFILLNQTKAAGERIEMSCCAVFETCTQPGIWMKMELDAE